MKVIGVTVLAAFVGLASGACEKGCNNRGHCTNYAATFSSSSTDNPFTPETAGGSVNALGYDSANAKKDSCTCYLRKEGNTDVYAFTGPDCADYTCPAGAAFNGVPNADNDHTQVVECSGVGTCDRKTGVCKCQEGFTGKACNRQLCPNDCSGRGNCVALRDYVESVKENDANLPFDSSSFAYTAWDADISHGCVCDAGYAGADCSKVECPSGADPMGGKGSDYGRACSGRGTCNEDSGVCTCHKGYYGNRCESQTNQNR